MTLALLLHPLKMCDFTRNQSVGLLGLLTNIYIVKAYEIAVIFCPLEIDKRHL